MLSRDDSRPHSTSRHKPRSIAILKVEDGSEIAATPFLQPASDDVQTMNCSAESSIPIGEVFIRDGMRSA
jgi:hypothetical protein